MTEKEMRKLNRYQLLELLLIQSEQVNSLQRQIEELQRKLDSREIHMSVAGSIAEASMELGGIFEAAQKTADIYLHAVIDRVAEIEANAYREAERIVQEAQMRATQILDDAEDWKDIDDAMQICQYGTDEL